MDKQLPPTLQAVAIVRSISETPLLEILRKASPRIAMGIIEWFEEAPESSAA